MSINPDDMDLDELREEIQNIDREIVELIAQRTYVADTIAQVKEEQDLPTTDEAQEQPSWTGPATTLSDSTLTTTS